MGHQYRGHPVVNVLLVFAPSELETLYYSFDLKIICIAPINLNDEQCNAMMKLTEKHKLVHVLKSRRPLSQES